MLICFDKFLFELSKGISKPTYQGLEDRKISQEEWDGFKLHSRQGEFTYIAHFVHKVQSLLHNVKKTLKTQIRLMERKKSKREVVQDLSARWINMNAQYLDII